MGFRRTLVEFIKYSAQKVKNGLFSPIIGHLGAKIGQYFAGVGLNSSGSVRLSADTFRTVSCKYVTIMYGMLHTLQMREARFLFAGRLTAAIFVDTK